MLAGAQKLEKVGGRNGSRAVVAQRMKIERLERQHAFVEHDAHLSGGVVEDREWRDGARLDSERLDQQFARAEGKARRAQRLGQLIEVDLERVPRHDQPETVLLVLAKEILGVAARLAGVERGRPRDSEDRSVDVRRPGDAEILQPGIERGFAFRRRGEWQAHGTRRLIHSGSAKAAEWTSGL